MKKRIVIPLAVLAVAATAVGVAALRPESDLRAEFERRLTELRSRPEGTPLTEADIAHLPASVQRYIRRAGALGQPPVTMVHTVFEATLYSSPESAGMSGPAHQIDVLDPPRRLFFMTTRMNGLPVAILHDYTPEYAGMRARAARLFNVVDRWGLDFARIESVTFLNDLCIFAPSALAGPAFAWTPIDDRSAQVRYAIGPHSISATLFFDEEGDLVNFASDDRADISGGGEPERMRWTTPLSDFREIDGRRVPGRGEAIWHRDDGPFTYGEFAIRDVTFNRLQDVIR